MLCLSWVRGAALGPLVPVLATPLYFTFSIFWVFLKCFLPVTLEEATHPLLAPLAEKAPKTEVQGTVGSETEQEVKGQAVTGP